MRILSLLIPILLISLFFPHTITYTRQPDLEIVIEEIGWREITAYNAVPEQTDDEPCISASGMNVCQTPKKICASNEFPFGTLLLIGDEIWEVQDKTHSRYSYRIDLLMEEYHEAREWGKQILIVKVIREL